MHVYGIAQFKVKRKLPVGVCGTPSAAVEKKNTAQTQNVERRAVSAPYAGVGGGDMKRCVCDSRTPPSDGEGSSSSNSAIANNGHEPARRPTSNQREHAKNKNAVNGDGTSAIMMAKAKEISTWSFCSLMRILRKIAREYCDRKYIYFTSSGYGEGSRALPL